MEKEAHKQQVEKPWELEAPGTLEMVQNKVKTRELLKDK